MANVAVTTQTFHGDMGGAASIVLFEDFHRRFFALYAATGTCYFSIGPAGHDHSDFKIAIPEGGYYDTYINLRGEVQYSGAGTTLRVIRDIDSITSHILTYDGHMISYDGTQLSYGF